MIKLIILVSLHTTIAQLSSDPERLLNWCLDGRHHKSTPGPEDSLHDQCAPWKNRACCTSNTTRNLHYNNLYKFNYNHCSHRKNMSSACRRHFTQDECFYECSPNIGPWVVKIAMNMRNERFFGVPLCASDCDVWFEACKDDFTCSDNWVHNTMGEGGLSPCQSQTECRTFSDIFSTSKDFCEKVWDYSWKYTEDTQPCMRMWFNGSQGNPNDMAAKYYTEKLLNEGTSVVPQISFILTICSFIVMNNRELFL